MNHKEIRNIVIVVVLIFDIGVACVIYEDKNMLHIPHPDFDPEILTPISVSGLTQTFR